MAPTLTKVEAFPIRYPVAGRFKFFEEQTGRPMGRYSVLVKLTTDDGTVGWGQSVPSPRWSYETLESVYYTIRRYFTPMLIGKDPFDHEGIFSAFNQAIAPSFSTGQPICKAGVDLALFDLTGKLLGQNAAERWQRKSKERLAISYTLNPKSLDEVEGLVANGRTKG